MGEDREDPYVNGDGRLSAPAEEVRGAVRKELKEVLPELLDQHLADLLPGLIDNSLDEHVIPKVEEMMRDVLLDSLFKPVNGAPPMVLVTSAADQNSGVNQSPLNQTINVDKPSNELSSPQHADAEQHVVSASSNGMKKGEDESHESPQLAASEKQQQQQLHQNQEQIELQKKLKEQLEMLEQEQKQNKDRRVDRAETEPSSKEPREQQPLPAQSSSHPVQRTFATCSL